MPVGLPSGYDPNNLLPFIGFNIRLGAGARTTPQPRSIVILANKIQTSIVRTIGSSTYTTAAGTLAAATPTFVASPDDGDALAGTGSEAALAYRAIYAQWRRPSVYFCLVAENGSAVKATALLLFAGTPTGSGVVRLKVSGRIISEVTVTTSSTAATVAADVGNAVNRLTHFPATATVSTATTTLAAKQGGPRGNNLALECEITAAGMTVAINGGSGVSKGTARFGAGTATAGAGVDDVTAALTAIAPNKYFIVAAQDDATNWLAIRAHLATYAAITERKRQQAVIAFTNGTVGTVVTRALALNAMRMQMVYHRDASPGGTVDPNIATTAEIAANAAAGRLYGDSAVGNGGTVRGEIAYAAANLNNMQLGGVYAQSDAYGARLTDTEMQQLLFAGVSPIRASLRNPGQAELVRSVTTYSIDGSGNPTNSVRLTSLPTVVDVAAERFEGRVASEYPNKNIGEEPANPGTPPPHPDIIFPSMVKGSLKSEMSTMQNTDGLLVKTAANNALMELEQYDGDPSLLVAEIPLSVIPPFNALAGTLSEVGQ